MKKLLFLMFLSSFAYGQELWKVLNGDIVPYNRTHRLTLRTQTIFYAQPVMVLGIEFYGDLNNGFLVSPSLTALRTWTFPDYSGTIALEQKRIATVTGNFTADDTCHTILVTCSSANITITLPSASSNTGRIYNIKKIDATGYSVIIDPNSSELVDGYSTISFDSKNTVYSIQSNGTGWYVVH